MEKLNAYIVMTNGAINIVTTDPNVADQAKMKSPGSVVKRFPLTSKMAGSTGLVGEALDGDFEMGAEDGGSIGQDDVEFATDDQPQDDMSMDDGEEVPMDDVEGSDDTTDVICMNTELAVRVFEYIAQNQIDGEELQALADKMADLGNQSDDVLTGEHFDEITGGQDQGDEFVDDDEFADDGEIDPMSGDGMIDQSDEQGNDEIAADLELGEDAFDDMDPHGRGGMLDDTESELEFDNSESQVSDADERLMAQFVAGQISREELIDGLSQGSQDDYTPRSDTDPYGDDVSSEFDEFDSDDELEEDMQQPQGTQQQQQQAPTQNPAQFDGAYMNGYNTAKRGGQAQQQNINTPQGSAYNRGFMDAKANKPSVPPSKQQNESAADFEPTYQAKVSSRNGKWYLVYGNGKRVPGYGPFDSRPEVQEEIDDLYKSSKQQNESVNVNPTGNYDAGSHYHVREGYNDGREYGGAGKGRSADATETAKITAKAKAAAKKAGKTFDTSAQYRSWYSKQKKSATSGSVREGVETFGAYLAAMEKKVDRTVAPTIATLFKAKKQKATEAEKHFDIEQDPKTSAVKITNTSAVVPKR